MRRRPLLVPVLLVAGLTAGILASKALATEQMDNAQAALDRLETKLKKRSTINEEQIAGMEEVMEFYRGLKPPEKPEAKPVPDGASDDEKEAIHRENEKLERDYEHDLKKWDREVEKYKQDVRDVLIKAFKLTYPDVRTKRNRRDDVNIRAVELLATMGENPDLADDISQDIIDALERVHFKAKDYDVTELLFEKAFAALGTLNSPKSLEWMIEEFTHAKSSPQVEVIKLSAAHKGMLLFKDVPGKLRYDLVGEMVKTYAGVESQAEQNSNDKNVLAKKQFWDRIKADVIKAVQYYSGEPQDENGQLIARMDGFQEWFRDHDNKRRPPWVDPKPEDN